MELIEVQQIEEMTATIIKEIRSLKNEVDRLSGIVDRLEVVEMDYIAMLTDSSGKR